jgi:hypothetical protein
MTVAPGLLDQRLSFYERTDAGADGFVRPTYVRTATYWGRVDATSNAFTVVGAPQSHTDNRTSLVATVADYVTVDPFGLVRVEGDPALYFVRGVYAVRALMLQQITLDAVDPTAYATFTIYEAAEVDDGVHLVVPGGAFTSGFSTGYN